jgi:hypothetical protein
MEQTCTPGPLVLVLPVVEAALEAPVEVHYPWQSVATEVVKKSKNQVECK